MDDTLPLKTSLKDVKGWLLFLCISLTILSPLYALGQGSLAWKASEPYFAALPGLRNATNLEVFLTICLTLFSIGAGTALWSARPAAVKTVKAYLWTVMIFAVVCPMVVLAVANLPEAANKVLAAEAVPPAFLAIVNAALWLLYLNKSKRVRATFY